jgi:putative ABC transport system permease protein
MSLNFLLKFARRNKFYTLLNLAGLSLGIACWWLISAYVGNELNYDGYQRNRHRIYRLTTTAVVQGVPTRAAGTSAITGPRLMKDFPEIEATATFVIAQKVTVRFQNKIFRETGFYDASRDVFKIFSYHLLEGDPRTALEKPNSIVLTESIAKKYFGTTDPIGRQVSVNENLYQVTGVLKDLPKNSDLYFTALRSFDPLKVDDPFNLEYYTYILVTPTANGSTDDGTDAFVHRFDNRLVGFSDRLFNDQLNSNGENVRLYLHAQPMAGMHFDNSYLVDTPKGEKAYVYIFPLVGFFILVIVCFNYINLSIAQSTRRSREIAVKKVVGASMGRLFQQFMLESLLMAFAALVLAAGLAIAAIPFFNQITGKEISPSDLLNWRTLIILLISYVFVGLSSGIYPAIYLSRLNPLAIIKSNFTQGGKGNFLRASLLVTQFVISNGMIACSIVAYNHLLFLRKADLGFNSSQLVVIEVPAGSNINSGLVAFRNTLEKQGSIGLVAFGGIGSLPGGHKEASSAVVQSDTGKRTIMVNNSFVDQHYNQLLQIRLLQGSDFGQVSQPDSNAYVLVNEALVKAIGWKEPIGKTIRADGEKSTVIGVIKDFNYSSLHNKLEPLVVHYQSGSPIYLFLRVAPANIGLVADLWHKNIPHGPFDYRFVDQVFDEQYKYDSNLMTLFTGFCLVTVVVACIGLFGIFSLRTAQRTREISIRKVLGGSPAGIIYVLSRKYMANVLIAILISTPVAWYCMTAWERNFAYHEKISLGTFMASGASSFVIALGTILVQALRAARANPARALKAE